MPEEAAFENTPKRDTLIVRDDERPTDIPPRNIKSIVRRFTQFMPHRRKKEDSEEILPLSEVPEERYDALKSIVKKVNTMINPFEPMSPEYRQWRKELDAHESVFHEMLESNDAEVQYRGVKLLESLSRPTSEFTSIDNYTHSIFEKQIHNIEKVFLSKNPQRFDIMKQQTVLRLLSEVGVRGNVDQSQLVQSFFQAHEDIFKDRIIPVLTDSRGDVWHFTGPELQGIGALYAHGIDVIPSNPEYLKELHERLLTEGKHDRIGILAAGLLTAPRHNDAYVHGKEWLEGVFKTWGFDNEELPNAWKLVGERKRNEVLAQNILQMHELEVAHPGSTKILHEEFGINNFYRYPLELLKRQYERRNETDRPYGIVLAPFSDHNGAFGDDQAEYAELFGAIGEDYDIRIVEASNKIDIARRLLALDERYGDKHKIEFAIIAGHGTKDSILFGGRDRLHSLYTSDLQGKGLARTGTFFTKHPTFILLSCSTGITEGIAQGLHETMEADVFAPNIPTSAKTFGAKIENGKAIFDVKYKKKDEESEDPTVAYTLPSAA